MWPRPLVTWVGLEGLVLDLFMATEEKDVHTVTAASTAQKQALVYDRVVRDHVKQDRPYSHLIDLITIAEGSIVLDIGCGTGYLSSFLAERVGPSGHVIAVDPDRERIRVAKANVKVANITFLVADGETFPEQEYDAVFVLQRSDGLHRKQTACFQPSQKVPSSRGPVCVRSVSGPRSFC